MKQKTALLIINPVAGKKKANSIIYDIIDSLCRSDYITTTFTTAKKGDATDIVLKHADGFDKIICCGGDGTLNEVITGLATAKLAIPVGYVPTGTTNDLAHTLNLPKKTKSAIKITSSGNIRRHDIGSFNENQYFSYVASFGAFTKASYDTPQWLKNLIGRIAYIFRGILSIADIRPHTVKIVADGKEIEGDFIYGSVSNSTVIGGFIKFSESEICLDDGLFEVLLVKKPKSVRDRRGIVRSIKKCRYDSPCVYFIKAHKISFIFEKSTEWSIDGEYAGTLDSVYIENLLCQAQIITASKS